MGNTPNKRPSMKRQFTKGDVNDKGFQRYNAKEFTLLDRLFQDLARRSPAKTMSKATFLEYFALPGILGERLFEVFDTSQDGVIHFEEFVNGLARYNHGTLEDKIAMLFEMFDMDGKQQVNREELTIILYSVITPTTALFFVADEKPEEDDESKLTQSESKENIVSLKGISHEIGKQSGLVQDDDSKITHVSQFTRNTVSKLVDEAFTSCDTNKDGLLSQEQFANWVQQNPSTLALLETVFAKHLWGGWNDEHETMASGSPIGMNVAEDDEDFSSVNRATSLRTMPSVSALRAASSRGDLKGLIRAPSMAGLNDSFMFDKPIGTLPTQFRGLYSALAQQYYEESTLDAHVVYLCNDCKFVFYTSLYVDDNTKSEVTQEFGKYVVFKKSGVSELKLKFCPQCGVELVSANVQSESYLDLQSAVDLMPLATSAHNTFLNMEGMLYKIGNKTKIWVARYYVIKEKFLYIFKKQNDVDPVSVLFISGWFISKVKDNYVNKGYYGFELTPPASAGSSKKLYAKTEQERDFWVKALQEAASTVSIHAHYKIGKALGKGHFSVVHVGTHLQTKKQYAIKVVEKKRIDAREKMSLRNEIAIMKLVNHPCIIHMEDIYEDKKCIYMVMKLVQHGDFFARWKSKKIFEENIVRIIIWKLLDAVQYLHSLGIVHRDLKPENILCLSDTDDTAIVISDFGLSKFAAPHTEMTMPCGTLAYVAPEVLSQKGYGRKVDLWSLGCIMHLLLRGVLPFDGHTKEDVIERTLNKTLNLSGPKWAHVSDVAKDLLFHLLIKDPAKRVDLNGAIAHAFFNPLKNLQIKMQTGIDSTLKGVLTGFESPAMSPRGSPNTYLKLNTFGAMAAHRKNVNIKYKSGDSNSNSNSNGNNNTDGKASMEPLVDAAKNGTTTPITITVEADK